MAAGPLSLVVGVHDHVYRATVQFVLQQSFLARAAEEEKAKEAEVKMLEDDVADKESPLLEALCKVRDASARPPWSTFSGIEKAAVHWRVALDKARKKKGRKKRKKRRRRWTSRSRVLVSSEKYWAWIPLGDDFLVCFRFLSVDTVYASAQVSSDFSLSFFVVVDSDPLRIPRCSHFSHGNLPWFYELPGV